MLKLRWSYPLINRSWKILQRTSLMVFFHVKTKSTILNSLLWKTNLVTNFISYFVRSKQTKIAVKGIWHKWKMSKIVFVNYLLYFRVAYNIVNVYIPFSSFSKNIYYDLYRINQVSFFFRVIILFFNLI